MDKLQKSREERESKFTTADPRKVYSKSWNPEIPRPRVCPSCGMLLKKDEYLYASISDFKNSEGKRQAHIYGCKYCYLGEAQTTDIQRGPEEIQDL
jgi:transposase